MRSHRLFGFSAVALLLALALTLPALAGGSPSAKHCKVTVRNSSSAPMTITYGRVHWRHEGTGEGGSTGLLSAKVVISPNTAAQFDYELNDGCKVSETRLLGYPNIIDGRTSGYSFTSGDGIDNPSFEINESDLADWRNGQDVNKHQ
jgi:hypothetical protein